MIQFFKKLFGKSETYDVFDIYTPTKPATHTFIERKEINSRLISSIKTPGKLVIVYGHSGSGKSTLILNKLKENYNSYIVSRCTRETKYEELLLDAYDQLNKFYVQKISNKDGEKLSGDLEGNAFAIKATLTGELSNEKTKELERAVPFQINERKLAKYLKELKCCWIIEDFHKVSNEEKLKLSDCLKVFFDEEGKVIAIGAVGTAREVIQYNNEMSNRVAEILVSLMREEQLFEIIGKGEPLLNISVEEEVKNKIVKFSSGLASVCHQICLNICIEKGVYKTSNKKIIINGDDFLKGINRYVFDISDTLKKDYDKATNFSYKGNEEIAKELIKSMLSIGKDEFTFGEIERKAFRTRKIRVLLMKYEDFDEEVLELLIEEFTTKKRANVLRYDSNSNKYSFSNPFFVAYCYCLFEGEIVEEENVVTIKDSKNVIHNSTISVKGDFRIGDSNINIGDISKGGKIKIDKPNKD